MIKLCIVLLLCAVFHVSAFAEETEYESVVYDGFEFFIPSGLVFEEQDDGYYYYTAGGAVVFCIAASDMPVEMTQDLLDQSVELNVNGGDFEKLDAKFLDFPSTCVETVQDSYRADIFCFCIKKKMYSYSIYQSGDYSIDYFPLYRQYIEMMNESSINKDRSLQIQIDSLINWVDSESKTDADSQSTYDTTLTISPGTYVVGEDIEAGTYSLSVIDGKWGEIMLFKDYDTFISNNGSILDAIANYYVSSPDSNLDYPSEVGSIKLVDGMCLFITGVTSNATKLR